MRNSKDDIWKWHIDWTNRLISRDVPLNDMTESGGLDVKELGRWALRIALLGVLVYLYVDDPSRLLRLPRLLF